MRRLLRWFGYGLAGLLAMVVFVAVGGFAASEVMIRKTPGGLADQAVKAAADPGAVERGRRIATVAGCHDCHGRDLTGRLFHDEPPIVRAYAPNLTIAVAEQTDAQLERAIRRGIGADGRPLWIMPSSSFAHFSDAETADLLAYLRTRRPAGERQPRLQVGPVGRVGVLLGKFRSEPAVLRGGGARDLPDLGPRYAQGRAIARACVECHGAELKGSEVTHAPDLMVAAAYDLPDFERLLRTGVAAGDRRLGLMSEAAPGRFGALTHQEIAALHDYLKARAEKSS